MRRFRMPLFLLLLALMLWQGPIIAADYVTVPEGWLPDLHLVARVLLVASIGWLIITIVDALLKRRLSMLKLDQDDNLRARQSATRLDVIRRVWVVIGGVLTTAAALTIVPGVKQFGVSLFASAGIAGLAIGLAARPMLSNLIAGLQIAFTQPIRIEDAVVVENEWGWIEEIGLFYVVIRLWDWRRLIVPLSYFIETPFQNWTRKSASIIGTVTWDVDYHMPVQAMRDKLTEICEASQLWDQNVVNLQVVESKNQTLTIRALASARTSPQAWDLRCEIREKMMIWLQAEHADCLPRVRADVQAPPPMEGGAAVGTF